MARFTVIGSSAGGTLPAAPFKYNVKSGAAASIVTGMLVKKGSTDGFVVPVANGSTSGDEIVGVSTGPSTETATVDGTVQVQRAPILYVRGKATTPANLVSTMLGDLVTIDVASGSPTFDEDDTTNGYCKIVTFDNTTEGNVVCEIPCDQS